MIPWVGDSSFVIHVSKSGNDANGGVAQQYPVSLSADSKLTIGSAVSACPDGGIIVVWPGDYDETVDIETAAKKITLIGVSYRGSRIVPASGKGVIGYNGLHLENISVEVQDDASMAVDCGNQDDCSFKYCFIHTKGIDGIFAELSDRVVIDDCYIFASYDSVIVGSYGLIKNSIIVTDGCYTGSGTARAIGGAGISTYLRLLNSIVIAQPSYEKPAGKEPELYESDRDLYCIKDFGKLMLDNCILMADGYKPDGAHADSYASGNSYGIFTVWQAMLRNCSILSRTDQNQATTIAYGLYNSVGQLNNVNVETAGQAETYDFYAAFTKELWLVNTKYDSSKVNEHVVLRTVPDDDGRVEADTTQIKGSDATNQIRDAIVDDATRFHGISIAAMLADTNALEKLINADKVVDTSGSPWVLEYRDKDTKAVLLRQTMKNTAGETITSINNVLGQLEKE